MRSLTWKISAALVLVTLLGLALVAIFIRQFTVREFDRLRMEQQQVIFTQRILQYYELNGSWDGLDRVLQRQNQQIQQGQPNQPLVNQGNQANSANSQIQPPRNPPNAQGQAGRNGQGQTQAQNRNSNPQQGQGPLAPPPFLVVNNDDIAVTGGGSYIPEQKVEAQLVAQGKPLMLNGERIGTLINLSLTPEFDPRDQEYVAKTTQALIYATIGAGLLAVILGVWLARRLTRPLRDLTHALHGFRNAPEAYQLPVRSRDEIGEVVEAFNHMSADLAQANQLRRQATADIAHELRSPLTVVIGYLEGLRDGTLKPTPERFEVIYTEARQLQRLIEDLRTLSLADAGELPLHRERVRPADLVEDAVRTFHHLAETQQVALSASVGGELPPVEVDRSRLSQVLGNLIGNALRYTPPGGSIRLVAKQADAAVQIAVEDTGSGIPADKLPMVFHRLYRVDDSRQTTSGQTGLGLAIVLSLVQAHGGNIRADSVVGKGTTMTITLPLSA